MCYAGNYIWITIESTTMDKRKEIADAENFDHSDVVYFETVFRQLDESFESDEDQALFVNNVFNAAAGKELHLCRSRALAFGVEKLLQIATLDKLASFIQALADNITEVAPHPSASHSWQVTMTVCFKHMSENNEAFLEAVERSSESELHRHLATLTRSVVSCADYLSDNLDSTLGDSYSCHVLCSTMEVLCGLEPRKGRQDRLSKQVAPKKINVPPIFHKKSKCLAKTILERSDLKVLMLQCTSSKVLQTTVSILATIKPKDCDKFAQKFLTQLSEAKDDGGGIFEHLTHETAAPLLERLFDLCSEEQRLTVWKDHFQPHLEKLTTHAVGNFVVQKFIKGCTVKSQMETIYNDLDPVWDKFVDEGYLGILVELTGACERLCCCQAKLLERLATLLHCYQPVERRGVFFPLTLYWLYSEDLKTENYSQCKINYHGSMILQNVFKFQKPFLMVESLLGTIPSNLVSIICSPSGSHVLEAFANSRTLGIKNRLTLVESLKSHFGHLACDKFGSRFVEHLWKNVNVNARTTIIKELATVDDLINHAFGHFLYKSCAVHLYKRRPDQWEALQNQGVKHKSMLDSIVGAAPKKRPRFR